MKNYFILVVSVVLFLSCKDKTAESFYPSVLFKSSQPDNVSEMNHFPREYRGLYMSSDSNFIRILKDKILEEEVHSFAIHKNELDSIKEEFVIYKDKYISKISKDTFKIKNFKDSILFANKRVDTFFIFSASNKLKKIRNHLVISVKDSIFWEVKTLTLDKNSLLIKYIGGNENDIEKLDSITKIKSKMLSDSSGYIVQPTKKEFKNYLNKYSNEYQSKFNRIYE